MAGYGYNGLGGAYGGYGGANIIQQGSTQERVGYGQQGYVVVILSDEPTLISL